MKNFLQKLKSNKGATGADVVVALSVVVIGMAVVSMIYISLSNGGKRVTRTSGATRIAVNIMENIERLDYTKFEYEIGKLAYPYLTKLGTGLDLQSQMTEFSKGLGNVVGQLKSDGTSEDKSIVISKNMKVKQNSETDTPTDVTYNEVFGTKVPNGYNYTITVKSAPSGKAEYPWDLALRVIVKVTFKVNNREENVTLQTVKYRELLEVSNKPDMSMALSTTKSESEKKGSFVKNAFPVKVSSSNPDILERCSESDPDWYNYNGGKWALIYDCGNETDNAKEAARSSTISLSENKGNIKVWVPKYGYVTYNGASYYLFAYAQTVYPIYKLGIPKLSTGATEKVGFYCPMTFKELSNFKLQGTSNFGLSNGAWVRYSFLTETNASNYNHCSQYVNLAKGLLNTQYGFNP